MRTQRVLRVLGTALRQEAAGNALRKRKLLRPATRDTLLSGLARIEVVLARLTCNDLAVLRDLDSLCIRLIRFHTLMCVTRLPPSQRTVARAAFWGLCKRQ